MGAADPLNKQIILFDGVCNLCNQSVQFIIKRDPKEKFRFSALQSPAGQQLLRQHNLPSDSLYSIILVKKGQVHFRSTAALEIARQLKGFWPLLYALIVIPSFIRNVVYDWIARNRYQWFGRKNQCMIPTPELKSRFLN